MTRPGADLWTDRAFLRGEQYRTQANLAVRQSIYAYQQPPVDLPRWVLDLATPQAGETIADIGCGNGRYLAELARRGHTGPVLGLDLSPGMLATIRERTPGAALLNADAAALPLRDAAADLSLAMHMLYHVPDPRQAARELRRVTRPGGRVVVGLNGQDHLTQMREVVRAALTGLGQAGPGQADVPLLGERLGLDQGETLMRAEFGSVIRHEVIATLVLTDPEPVAAYVRSMSEAIRRTDTESLVAAVVGRLPSGPGAVFEVTTHSGGLICS